MADDKKDKRKPLTPPSRATRVLLEQQEAEFESAPTSVAPRPPVVPVTRVTRRVFRFARMAAQRS